MDEQSPPLVMSGCSTTELSLVEQSRKKSSAYAALGVTTLDQSYL